MPKSHDRGLDARVGQPGEGLLLVQGPLALNWRRRKFGLLPRIENGGLTAANPATRDRVNLWCAQGIQVQGAGEHVFVKIYTHGTQDETMRSFFQKGGLAELFDQLQLVADGEGASLHYVSAREMANVIVALEEGGAAGERLRDWRYRKASAEILKAQGA
jgi:hypothetical protein